MPDNLRNDIGHFNVFKVESFGESTAPVPYRKRDYFKITLIVGKNTIEYADKTIQLEKQALIFSNPQIPYRWEHTEKIQYCYFCIFNQAFFHQYGNLQHYAVFQPNGNHVFELTDEQAAVVIKAYERMFEERDSDYVHKYDVLRSTVYELVHLAMKMQPSATFMQQPMNASQRISTLFLELLERQFPIDDPNQVLDIRSASDFANRLNIHVNHLNRALKETTQKTTSQIIAERIAQEAKLLLKQTPWTVAEIAYALGFSEATHFNNFFKKHAQTNPLKFRNV